MTTADAKQNGKQEEKMVEGVVAAENKILDSALAPSEIRLLIKLDRRDRSLSDISRETGISLAHLSRIASGDRQPSIAVAKAIAEDLGVTVDALLTVLEEVKSEREREQKKK